MVTRLFYQLSVAFALVAGTAAGSFSLLTLEVFRQSPFGRTVAVLVGSLSAFTVYHVVLMVYGLESTVTLGIKSLTLTAVAAFVALTIRRRRRLQGGST